MEKLETFGGSPESEPCQGRLPEVIHLCNGKLHFSLGTAREALLSDS